MFRAQFKHKENAFEPFLSSETVNFHYGKHHEGYAKTLSELIVDTEYEDLSLEQIIIRSRKIKQNLVGDKQLFYSDQATPLDDWKIFNNASQLLNHDFYWKCLCNEKRSPDGKLLQMIEQQFGSFDQFKQEYIKFANSLFGSGWSWLVAQDGKLKFVNTSNAENPVGSDSEPLCVIDLWEHAYYIDYRNRRADYVSDLIHNCINWDFCSSLLLD